MFIQLSWNPVRNKSRHGGKCGVRGAAGPDWLRRGGSSEREARAQLKLAFTRDVSARGRDGLEIGAREQRCAGDRVLRRVDAGDLEAVDHVERFGDQLQVEALGELDIAPQADVYVCAARVGEVFAADCLPA